MLLTVLLPMPVKHGKVSQTGLTVYIARCIDASMQPLTYASSQPQKQGHVGTRHSAKLQSDIHRLKLG